MITAGFIGCGNMGGALCSAAAKAIGGKNIYASDYITQKADALCQKLGANVSTNKEIAQNCKYIFLGVKPQAMADTVKEIAPVLKKRKDNFFVVTMAAGISMKALEEMLGFNCPVIRIMPNTPCSVGKGLILYCSDADVSVLEQEEFESIFSCSGIIDRISENLIDAASAVSGCGPAFVYLFIEALADGGVECGLPRDKALYYAAQTVMGAAQMVKDTNRHPGELKDAVCSPGGTTIEGVRALEEGAFRATTMNSVIAAYEKTLKLKR